MTKASGVVASVTQQSWQRVSQSRTNYRKMGWKMIFMTLRQYPPATCWPSRTWCFRSVCHVLVHLWAVTKPTQLNSRSAAVHSQVKLTRQCRHSPLSKFLISHSAYKLINQTARMMWYICAT